MQSKSKGNGIHPIQNGLADRKKPNGKKRNTFSIDSNNNNHIERLFSKIVHNTNFSNGLDPLDKAIHETDSMHRSELRQHNGNIANHMVRRRIR